MLKNVTIPIAITALLSLGALGCPAEQAAKPPPKPSKAVPASQPASAPAAQPAPGGQATSRPASAPAPQRAAEPPITGLVRLSEGISADSVKPTDILFIMARSAVDGKAGPLVAVSRHAEVTFPMRYELSSKNLMMPGIPFAGPFIVNARLDRDGNPMTRSADDLYAAHKEPISGGATGIHLDLIKPKVVKAPPGAQPSSQPSAAPGQPAAPASQPAH